ncbi:MAG TPA: citrate/2-methylcitrate synthase, partial [Microlunatus sp.]|nr:citrate/2-methylcitrate synthase [Microlunatus sp.]
LTASIPVTGPAGGPMATLRTLLSGYGAATGVPPLFDQTPEQRLDTALRVGAVAPGLLAAAHRVSRGDRPLQPRDDLGFTANYLYQLSGTEPTPDQVAALGAYLIAAIDHGFNASTFTARVIASTGADLVACVTGALGALSGPLHGGAPGRALAALNEIGTADRIEPWVRAKITSGERIMGFGHPVYRTEDPRSAMLKQLALALGGPRVELAVETERQVLRLLEELKPGRALHTNIEFYAAIVMEHCGIPAELFTPTFAVARLIGWTAHVLEQAQDPKIIRPSSRYVGPPPPQPVPALAER